MLVYSYERLLQCKESLSLTNHVGKDSVSANRRRGMARLDQWETGEDPADTIRPRQWRGRGMREGGYVGNFRPQTAQS